MFIKIINKTHVRESLLQIIKAINVRFIKIIKVIKIIKAIDYKRIKIIKKTFVFYY